MHIVHIDLSKSWSTLQRMIDNFFALLPRIILGLIVLAAFVLLGRALKWLVTKAAWRRRRQSNLSVLLGRLANAVVLLFGLLVSLAIVTPSFQAADLIKVLGIGSIAIGFAFRDILQNFLAGILLLLHEPFRIGDQVKVADFEGSVEAIETRATVIRTEDSRRVVIPNSDLFTKAVTVNTAHLQRRSEYDVGIGYGDDVELARSVILQAVGLVEGVSDDPSPDVIAVELADYSVKLRVRWWTASQPARVLSTTGRVLEAIKAALSRHGIDMPFPTQQLLFHDQTEETDGDRARQREGWPLPKSGAPKARTVAQALLDVNGGDDSQRAA